MHTLCSLHEVKCTYLSLMHRTFLVLNSRDFVSLLSLPSFLQSSKSITSVTVLHQRLRRCYKAFFLHI